MSKRSEASITYFKMTDSLFPNVPSMDTLTPERIIAMRDSVMGQMDFGRRYTLGLLEEIPESYWNTIPAGATSHIAWQVGHLAVSQYGLMLFRQRGTVPPTEPSEIPTKAELLATLQRIHVAAMTAVPTFTAEQLSEPTEMPYAVYPIKLGALLFCPLHESIHAGQIGLLRRMHGMESVR
jgi:hypothetical protein